MKNEEHRFAVKKNCNKYDTPFRLKCLACKSMKVAYKIVKCFLAVNTLALLWACSEDSSWNMGMSAVPLKSGGETGNAPPAPTELQELPQ